MLGFYNYTVWLTYCGLASAVTGICLAITGNIQGAVICLMVSGLCDMFDGRIARTKKDRTEDEKQFGIQIDSLCDVVCFGVLPAVLGFALGCTDWWQIVISSAFVCCGVIRLGYFNVTEEARQKTSTEKRHTYNGLPITSSALAVPLLMCFHRSLGQALPFVYIGLLALLAVLYITPFSIRKPGKWGAVAFIVIGVAILLALVL